MKFASATHIGRVRQENEDYIIAKKGVFIVADGMGGHIAGGIASKTAAQTVYKIIDSTKNDDKLAVLKKALQAANNKVIEKSLELKAQNGIGTTLTMALIDGLTAYLAHIGDSRAYLLRDGKLKQLTEDHSLVAEMVKKGKISTKEARKHPYRNVITKAIGSDPNLDIDLFTFKLNEGDQLLLASDGLTSLVKDWEISKIIKEAPSLSKACEQLVKTANSKGGQDNISVILVQIGQPNQKVPLKTNFLFKPKFKSKYLTLIIALVIALAIFLSGFYLNKNSFYLSTYKGRVALYQGLPYSFLGFKFGKVKYISKLSPKQLDNAMKSRLAKKIIVKSQKEGMKDIKDMEEEVNQ